MLTPSTATLLAAGLFSVKNIVIVVVMIAMIIFLIQYRKRQM